MLALHSHIGDQVCIFRQNLSQCRPPTLTRPYQTKNAQLAEVQRRHLQQPNLYLGEGGVGVIEEVVASHRNHLLK